MIFFWSRIFSIAFNHIHTLSDASAASYFWKQRCGSALLHSHRFQETWSWLNNASYLTFIISDFIPIFLGLSTIEGELFREVFFNLFTLDDSCDLLPSRLALCLLFSLTDVLTFLMIFSLAELSLALVLFSNGVACGDTFCLVRVSTLADLTPCLNLSLPFLLFTLSFVFLFFVKCSWISSCHSLGKPFLNFSISSSGTPWNEIKNPKN